MKCEVILAALVFGIISVEASCPNKFTGLCGKCYKYVGVKKTFAKAEDNCLALGGYLAEPRSRKDYETIKLILENKIGNGFWIGGIRLNLKWEWSHSLDPINLNNLPWHWTPNQPDDSGRCLWLWKSYGYGLDDNDCNREPSKSVCQADALRVKNTTTELVCRKGDSSCYFIPGPRIIESQHSAAVDQCSKLKATLPVPKNSNENRRIRTLVGQYLKSTSIWLGVTDLEQEGSWMSEVTGSGITYTNWKSGEPSGAKKENCVVAKKGYWSDNKCNSSVCMDVICEIEHPLITCKKLYQEIDRYYLSLIFVIFTLVGSGMIFLTIQVGNKLANDAESRWLEKQRRKAEKYANRKQSKTGTGAGAFFKNIFGKRKPDTTNTRKNRGGRNDESSWRRKGWWTRQWQNVKGVVTGKEYDEYIEEVKRGGPRRGSMKPKSRMSRTASRRSISTRRSRRTGNESSVDSESGGSSGSSDGSGSS